MRIAGQVKWTLAPAFLASLILVGCASTPASRTASAAASAGARAAPAAAPKQSPDALLAASLRLVENASPASLAEAARALQSPDIVGARGLTAVTALGRDLFGRLYPDIDNPFPADTPKPVDGGAGVSPLMAQVAPTLALLDPSAAPDASTMQQWASALSSADKLDPASILPPYLQALLAERQAGNAAATRALYEECLRRAPSFYPAALRISAIIIAGGDGAAQLSRLQQLASQMPTASLRFAALARADLAGGKPQEAADAAAQGLLVTPNDPSFAVLRAQAFEALGDWYQSLRLLDTLLRVAPDVKSALLMKARLLWEKQSNDGEAIPLLLTGESLYPADASFPELRGTILLATGRTEEGVAALTRAVQAEPGRVTSLTLLLRQAATDERWGDATTLFAQIPQAAHTPEHLRLAWQAAMGLGDFEQAIAMARELESIQGGPAAQALEARALVAAGRAAVALPLVDKALAAADAPTLRSELYAIRATAGSDDPLRDLRSSLVANPDNGEALVAISDLFAAEKDYRKALEYAKRAAELSPGNQLLAQKVTNLESQQQPGG